MSRLRKANAELERTLQDMADKLVDAEADHADCSTTMVHLGKCKEKRLIIIIIIIIIIASIWQSFRIRR